jgi:Fe-S oxidoreductase
VATFASATAPFSNWLARREMSRRAMEKVLGIDARRDLPEFRRETLVDWFEGRRSATTSNDGKSTRCAILYPDLYTNHVQVERGKAAVRVLEALGVDVVVPPVASSGRAPLSQGMIDTARDHAERVAADLEPHLTAGRDVVVIEPGDQAMFEREYKRLLDEDTYEELAEASYEVMEYVFGLLENGADANALRDGTGEKIAYHSHCQQRTLGLEAHTEAILDRRDFDVFTSNVECCGMTGSFGYESQYYEVAMAVGDELQEQFSTEESRDRTVVPSGTSCLEQLDALLERQPTHPVELLAPQSDQNTSCN